eukprot:5260747-Pyramimonas_sp.AAC.1
MPRGVLPCIKVIMKSRKAEAEKAKAAASENRPKPKPITLQTELRCYDSSCSTLLGRCDITHIASGWFPLVGTWGARSMRNQHAHLSFESARAHGVGKTRETAQMFMGCACRDGITQDENDRVTKAFNTLLTYLGNIVRDPAEEKFRRINLNNAAFQRSLRATWRAARCSRTRARSEPPCLPSNVSSVFRGVAAVRSRLSFYVNVGRPPTPPLFTKAMRKFDA